MRRAALAGAIVSLISCAPYADFTLPALSGNATQFNLAVRPGPVIAKGAAGAWDSVDALNPSVVSAAGKLLNLYSGYDGRTWHTGLAESSDGLQWTKRGKVLSPDPGSWEGDYIAANGSVIESSGEFLYWYQGGRIPQIGLARSKDGLQWNKHQEPVLKLGPRGSWDERGVADPYVIRTGEWFYMYYLGQDRAERQRLGVARSKDGVSWEKLRSNPILQLGEYGAFDETGLGEPAVWSSHGSYWMLYTARDRKEVRRMGLARSPDGVHWTRVSISPFWSGNETWNAKVVCDATVLVDNDRIRIWYGGGDAPRPAENLNGQIGYAELRPRPSANLN
jgi:predicted GH43/DUF377 family glycosyl hydrolase